MFAFIAIRISQALLTLLAVSFTVFALSHVTGSPVDAMLGPHSTAEQREALTRQFGFDRPLHEQYAIFISNAVTGDFGQSIRTRQPVIDMVAGRFWSSLQLASASAAFAVTLSVPLGILAAVHRRRLWDRIAMTFAMLGQSVPPFFFGIIAIHVFATVLGLLPAQGTQSPAHFVLPVITMGWVVSAGLTRVVRSSMLEILDAEFIKLARSKGLSESVVVVSHAFRNALIPVSTFVAYIWAILVGTAVATEVVFGWPGLGRLAWEAVAWRDFPVLQAVVLLWAVVIIGANLIVDVAYGLLDPRVRT